MLKLCQFDLPRLIDYFYNSLARKDQSAYIFPLILAVQGEGAKWEYYDWLKSLQVSYFPPSKVVSCLISFTSWYSISIVSLTWHFKYGLEMGTSNLFSSIHRWLPPKTPNPLIKKDDGVKGCKGMVRDQTDLLGEKTKSLETSLS